MYPVLSGDHGRRAPESGKDYRALPDSSIIFAYSFDCFGGGTVQAAWYRFDVISSPE